MKGIKGQKERRAKQEGRKLKRVKKPLLIDHALRSKMDFPLGGHQQINVKMTKNIRATKKRQRDSI